jgi:hypothetical protein
LILLAAAPITDLLKIAGDARSCAALGNSLLIPMTMSLVLQEVKGSEITQTMLRSEVL